MIVYWQETMYLSLISSCCSVSLNNYLYKKYVTLSILALLCHHSPGSSGYKFCLILVSVGIVVQLVTEHLEGYGSCPISSHGYELIVAEM